jgi:ferredoxin
MRVVVDMENCHGHARCASLLPELFDSDDLGYAIVKDEGRVPLALEERVRIVVQSCPERAIRTEEN